jgi:hypothetical protein
MGESRHRSESRRHGATSQLPLQIDNGTGDYRKWNGFPCVAPIDGSAQTIAPSLNPEIVLSDVIDPLSQLAADPIPNIRFNVAKCLEILGMSYGPAGSELARTRVIPLLEQQKSDTDADVRYFASRALQKMTSGMQLLALRLCTVCTHTISYSSIIITRRNLGLLPKHGVLRLDRQVNKGCHVMYRIYSSSDYDSEGYLDIGIISNLVWIWLFSRGLVVILPCDKPDDCDCMPPSTDPYVRLRSRWFTFTYIAHRVFQLHRAP